jgi:hypothetical protein
MPDDFETVNKGGEQWFLFSTYPTKDGLLVRVKAHSIVEEFFKSLGSGETTPISLHGKKWSPANPNSSLLVYHQSRPINQTPHYDTNIPGQSLGLHYGGDPHGDWPANLSFLKLKGISDPAGVEFYSQDVFSLDFRRNILKRNTANAFRRFVQDHLKPIKVTLIMSSQEF